MAGSLWSGLQIMSDFRRPPIKAERVTVTVKWFNATKGFGFVQLDDGSDAFLHASVLMETGHSQLTDGSTLVCDIADGRKGQQVLTIHKVTLADALPRRGPGGPRRDFGDRGGFDQGGFGGGRSNYGPPRGGGSRDQGPATVVDGTVKFFNTEKGYGFIVRVSVRPGQKGPVASEVELL